MIKNKKKNKKYFCKKCGSELTEKFGKSSCLCGKCLDEKVNNFKI